MSHHIENSAIKAWQEFMKPQRTREKDEIMKETKQEMMYRGCSASKEIALPILALLEVALDIRDLLTDANTKK